MSKILFLSNHFITLYSFRKELIKRLVREGNDIYISTPKDARNKYFSDLGCVIIETAIDRHGINPIKDIRVIKRYIDIMYVIKPDLVLSYTIKPNLYGGMAAAFLKIPYLPNVTGLGTAVMNGGIIRSITLLMYRYAFRKTNCIFVQNKSNRHFFLNRGIKSNRLRLLPGSGVNTEEYSILDYQTGNETNFVFISRIMKDKGIDHYLRAAEHIREIHSDTHFHICGFCEEEYEDTLKELQDRHVIIYHGMVSDVKEILKVCHCIVHPSYHEGMSNVLLEGSACGRPGLCSDIPGCNEIIDDGVSGFLFKPKSTESLIEAIEKFLALSWEERKEMGLNARAKVEKEFDRNIVVNAYLEEISKITEAEK